MPAENTPKVTSIFDGEAYDPQACFVADDTGISEMSPPQKWERVYVSEDTYEPEIDDLWLK